MSSDYEKEERANEYFMKRTKNVYIDRCNGLGIETFEQYLNHRYKDSCYNYSFYALMGLNKDDILLRGNIDVYGNRKHSYHHGWVEFSFENEQYVFDNHINGVVLKEKWYERKTPIIDYQKTQEEIFKRYLNDTYAFEVAKGFWQMHNVIYAGYKDYKQLEEAEKENKENGYVPSCLQRARVVISSYSGEVTRFIAYDPPSW